MKKDLVKIAINLLFVVVGIYVVIHSITLLKKIAHIRELQSQVQTNGIGE